MYEFETKSLLKIIFVTFVIWNNCFFSCKMISFLWHIPYDSKKDVKASVSKIQNVGYSERIVSVVRKGWNVLYFTILTPCYFHPKRAGLDC